MTPPWSCTASREGPHGGLPGLLDNIHIKGAVGIGEDKKPAKAQVQRDQAVADAQHRAEQAQAA